VLNFHRWFEEMGQWKTKTFEKHDHTKFSVEVLFFSVQNNHKHGRWIEKGMPTEQPHIPIST
jgi:hypothetical protein